jgi:signal transduction histidine kinase
VADNGIGIAPDQQERIFGVFQRLNTIAAEGHGVGLSIVKRIVEQRGGYVRVESQVGGGATFRFSVPA